ncbi:plasmid mobilization relaxosome protein MobC [Parashewanella curva]|uniref:Plasmid mobilization relaxosome protein MobC n=1 Tax=Parashewanella curva TaxID=2338552 RepID=A0A3L8PS89_9GAMM|nr:plasmid mobilization relaxosome protein MobC [Parashewanella curva]RLV58104.1 plasmid mobilization relaxosome protein MobC [Parashewanella curva]
MPKTEVHLEPDEKSHWQEYCRSHSMSEAQMLRMLINKASPLAANTDNFKESRTNKVTIRLDSQNHKKLSMLAKEEGYFSQTNWVTSTVLAHLHRSPVLSVEEMQVLRESNRQLSAIGRNLNQIAKVLNIEFRESDKITKEMIEMLSHRIDKHKDKVYTLLDKNRTRWSIDHEPTTE